MKMGEDDDAQFLIRIEDICDKLSEGGQEISDALKVVTTLNGLPPRFSTFIAIANQRSPPYTFEELKISLLNQEDIDKNEEMNDQVMYSTSKNYPKSKKKKKGNFWCSYHKSFKHDSEECKCINPKKKNKTKEKIAAMKTGESSSDDSDEISAAIFDQSSELSENEFSFLLDHCANVTSESDDLILVDSGCTTHIAKDKSRFLSLKSSENHSVCLADGQKLKDSIKGIGTVHEYVKDLKGKDVKFKLNDTFFIPNFRENILSVSKAVKGGHTVVFSPSGSKIILENGKEIKILHKKNLFYIKKEISNQCNVIKQDSLHDWHCRLGHLNKADVKQLQSQVDGMKISSAQDFDCDICLKGKMTNPVSKTPRQRSTSVFEMIHCDIVGPLTPTSKQNYRYSINFVDDCSDLVKIYFLKQKSDASQALMKFIAECADLGHVIRKVRADHGTEFTCNSFRQICLQNKIKLEFSSPRTPSQNGTAERNHRTIYEMARCLLLDSPRLPKSMWPYAVRAAANIRNRCINSRTGKTPFEHVKGRKPNLSKLKKFGINCFAYSEKSGKFDAKCKEGIYVGNDPESPAYLIYFPSSQKVLKIRNVRFPKFIAQNVLNTPRDFIQCEEKPEVEVEKPPSGDSPSTKEPSLQTPEESASPEEGRDTPKETMPAVERPKREVRKPEYLKDYVASAVEEHYEHFCFNTAFQEEIPKTYRQAVLSPQSKEWEAAMMDEMSSIKANDTYELVELPPDRTAIGSKWVYSIKPGLEGEKRYKARFVAKGFTQKYEIDYDETFSPTAQMTSLHVHPSGR